MCYICLPNKYNCETLLHKLNISFHALYFELDHIFNCLIKLFYFMFDLKKNKKKTTVFNFLKIHKSNFSWLISDIFPLIFSDLYDLQLQSRVVLLSTIFRIYSGRILNALHLRLEVFKYS